MADELPQTLRFQGVANRIARGALRAPVLSKVAGRHLITLYVVGRRSGKRYSVPVAYVWHDGQLLIGTPFAWGRNLRTGQAVEVRHLGKRRVADVRVHTAEAEVVADYAVIARHNPNFASFNKIRRDARGEPDAGDLHRAWRNGARAIRLTLR